MTMTSKSIVERVPRRLSRHRRVKTRPSIVTTTMLASGCAGGAVTAGILGSIGRSSTARVDSPVNVVGHRDTGVSRRSSGKSRMWLAPQVFEHAPQHDAIIETLARDSLRRRRVTLVVRIDSCGGVLDFLHRGKTEQPLAGRQHIAEASLLCDHRPAAGQIRGAAIAEPAAAQADVLVLRHGELAPRLADIGTIGVDVRREAQGIPHQPSVVLEQPAVLVFIAAQRQLEALAGSDRQIDELHELVVLAPVIDLSAIHDLAPWLPPVADRRKGVGGSVTKWRPEIEHDRLPCRDELEALGDGHQAIVAAVVLTPGEERAMRREIFDRLLDAVRDLDFDFDGIRANVYEASRFVML